MYAGIATWCHCPLYIKALIVAPAVFLLQALNAWFLGRIASPNFTIATSEEKDAG